MKNYISTLFSNENNFLTNKFDIRINEEYFYTLFPFKTYFIINKFDRRI